MKDGWSITGEQVILTVENRYLWIDIEASKAVDGLIILVEVKELDKVPSPIEALANAIGKYFLYRLAIDSWKTGVPLYLAVSEASYKNMLNETIGQLAIERMSIQLLVFSPEREEIVTWIA
jgi:hypothetical protein